MPDEVRQIPVQLIVPSPYQPRRTFVEEKLEELAASIRQQGILQPILVRSIGAQYELVAGERRLRAAQRAGLREVPAIVRGFSDEQAFEVALIENLQREDISIVEEARAYERLAQEFGYTQAEIAHKTGKSRAAVSNTLLLLQLPATLLDLLDRGELTEGHARALLALPYSSLQLELGEWIARNAVTVRETERKVRALLQPRSANPEVPAPSPDAHIRSLEDELRRHFGTRAVVEYRGGEGCIRLEFYTDDDLERILELLALPGG